MLSWYEGNKSPLKRFIQEKLHVYLSCIKKIGVDYVYSVLNDGVVHIIGGSPDIMLHSCQHKFMRVKSEEVERIYVSGS